MVEKNTAPLERKWKSFVYPSVKALPIFCLFHITYKIRTMHAYRKGYVSDMDTVSDNIG